MAKGDIWEIGDGEPVVSFESVSVAEYFPPTTGETNLWTLALIILGIWFAVRGL